MSKTMERYRHRIKEACAKAKRMRLRLAELEAENTRRLDQEREQVTPDLVRALRAHHGWTLIEMGRRLHVLPDTVGRWEHGKAKPHPATARALYRMMAGVGLVPSPPKGAAHEQSNPGDAGDAP